MTFSMTLMDIENLYCLFNQVIRLVSCSFTISVHDSDSIVDYNRTNGLCASVIECKCFGACK